MSRNDPDKEDNRIYKVVVNHEEQYSIWPADRENPLGWTDAGRTGTRAECLAYIEEVWTDMRPLSLRKKMEEAAQRMEPSEPAQSEDSESEDLVTYLSQGDHPVEISARSDLKINELKESIDRGYVHIKFTDTRGGTEFGLRLEQGQSDMSNADFGNSTGRILLIGGLTLNYEKVRCVADIDLQTLSGVGRLERA